jgi:ABC-type glutathione transport system ATPase component
MASIHKGPVRRHVDSRPAVMFEASKPYVSIRGVVLHYTHGRLFSRSSDQVRALDNVNLEIPRGIVMGMAGDSGSGKSTLARCLAMFERPDCGEIWVGDKNLCHRTGPELEALRPKIQMIFQDSASSLNPRFSAIEAICEPLDVQRVGNTKERRACAHQLMTEVGLSSAWAARPTGEFSGGQRQRIALARALALKPELLILDESLSALDISAQVELVNLLAGLRERHGFTCLFISHDLNLVARVAESVAVMFRGQIVEVGNCADVLGHPLHHHTQEIVRQSEHLRSAFANAMGAP